MFDGKAIGEMLVPVVRDYVSKAVGALADRLGAIEKRLADMPAPTNGKDGANGLDGKDGVNGADGKNGAPGDRGQDGVNGKDGSPGIDGKDGAPGIAGERGEKGEKGDTGPQGDQGPAGSDGAPGIAGKDGRDGIDGKDGAPGIAGERGEAGPQGEKGADGLNGKDGADGVSGKDGRDGIDGKDGSPGINGKDGADGVNGKDGAPGERGPEGQKGIDGRSVSLEEIRPILDGEVAKWALEFERRASDVLQKVVDSMPRAKDGRDGFSPEDLDLSFEDDGRTLNVSLRTSDREIVKSVTLPIPIDRGTYKLGMKAQQGDGITYGGSFWIAQRSTTDAPGNSDAWRLAVKKGRDAK